MKFLTSSESALMVSQRSITREVLTCDYANSICIYMQ